MFFLVFCSKPGFLPKSLQCLWLLPYSSHSKAAQLLFLVLLTISTMSPGKQCWGGAWGRAEPGLLPPCTSVMFSSCCCTVPAREGERKKNRKITGYLPQTLQLERARES